MDKIRSLITLGRIRLYAQRVLEGLTTGAIPALTLWMCMLVLYKTGWMQAETLSTWSTALFAFPLAGLAWALIHRIDARVVALRIDEHNGLHARITTAWCFSQEAEPTPFQRAAIDDAASHVEGAKVAGATPFRAPRDLIAMSLAACAVVAVILVKPPTIHGTLPPEDPIPEAVAVIDDGDLDTLKNRWEDVKKDLVASQDDKNIQIAADIEELIEKVEQKEISKEDLFHEIDKLEDRHFEDKDEEWKALEEEIKEVKDELAKNKHTKDIAKALEEGDLDKAAEEFEKLSKLLEEGKLKDKDLEALAKRLEDLAKKWDKENKALDDLLDKKKAEIDKLKKKLDKQKEKMTADQKKRLSRLERDLKKLTSKRDKHAKSAKGKALKKLSKASKEGGKNLRKLKKRGKGSTKKKDERASERKNFKQQMDIASRELKEISKKSKNGKSKDRAEQNLKDIKETAKRSGKPSDKRSAQLDDFNKRAAGQKPGEQKGKDGKPGQKGDQAGDKEGGKPGQKSAKAGQPKPGDPNGKGQPQQPGDGDKGAKPGGSEVKGGGDEAGKKEGTGDNKNKDAQGKGAGKGKGNASLGEKTALNDKGLKDTKVNAAQGDGPTKSEVIESAANEGFASTNYQEVFVEYDHVAEEIMEKEKIPYGYEFFVRRYFDAIRPRE
jgi:hypothetical protein